MSEEQRDSVKAGKNSENQEDHKQLGNDSFAAADYERSLQHYTNGIEFHTQTLAQLYANRAAAYLKLGMNQEAKADCEKTISVDNKCGKAYFRRALANWELGHNNAAVKDLKTVLRFEPKNGAARKKLKQLTRNTDFTVTVPDKLMCNVFKYVSLTDKFKLAAVNQKFRACVLKLFETPIPLKMKFQDSGFIKVNGRKLSNQRIFQAMRILAENIKFNGIYFGDGGSFDAAGIDRLDKIIDILVEYNCLSQVTSFKMMVVGCYRPIEKLIANCPQLQSLDMPTNVELRVKPGSIHAHGMLAALQNKPLTYMNFYCQYPQNEIIQLFLAIKPNTLRSVNVFLYNVPSLNVVQLVQELSPSAWTAVQEISFSWIVFRQPFDPEILAAFASCLPALRDCTIKPDFGETEKTTEITFQMMTTSVVSLLSKSDRSTNLVLTLDLFLHTYITSGCLVAGLLHKVKRCYPSVQFKIAEPNTCDYQMQITLGNVCFVTKVSGRYCNDSCVECRSFYPVVRYELEDQAESGKNKHLTGYQLDKCKLGCIVDDLNKMPGLYDVKALSVQGTGGRATLKFGNRKCARQFYISIDYGPCFNDSCAGCK